MDEKEGSNKEESYSSLSESWNIIDVPDVNNISEGSDGESIEVIEEDGNNNYEVKDNTQEANNEPEEGANFIKSEDETTVTSSQWLLEEPLVDLANDIPSQSTDVYKDMRVLNILGLLALICAVVCAGATSWFLLAKVEEMALGTVHYFFPERLKESNDNSREFDQLMSQLKAYEEETKNLRTLVTDLSGVVENLKKELAFSLKFADRNGPLPTASKQENQNELDEEGILFQELLNIHLGKYPDFSAFQNEVRPSSDPVAKLVQETISNFTSGPEKEFHLESIKLFYQIPKYLTVLRNFNGTDKNIEMFINAWRSKISLINEKIVEDMKNTQIRMIRQMIKQISRTQTKFYNKLCNLNGMKKQECHDSFIKPYKDFNELSFSVPPQTLDRNLKLEDSREFSDSDKLKIKVDDDFTKKTKRQQDTPERKISVEKTSEKPRENKENIKKKTENIKQENHDKQRKNGKVQGASDPPFEKKGKGQKKDYIPDKHPKERKYLYESVDFERGMNHDFNTDPENNDAINTFSSFSTVEGVEKETEGKKGFETRKDVPWEKEEEGLQKNQEKLMGPNSSEGCWFLNIGHHRSKMRKREARSNWLFERARRRRGRKT